MTSTAELSVHHMYVSALREHGFVLNKLDCCYIVVFKLIL
jgi:hypothetical protein